MNELTHEEAVTELDYWQREADKEAGGGESAYEREHIARMLRIHKAALSTIAHPSAMAPTLPDGWKVTINPTSAVVTHPEIGGYAASDDPNNIASCILYHFVKALAPSPFAAAPAASPPTRCSVSFAHPAHDFCDGNPDGGNFGDALKPAASPQVRELDAEDCDFVDGYPKPAGSPQQEPGAKGPQRWGAHRCNQCGAPIKVINLPDGNGVIRYAAPKLAVTEGVPTPLELVALACLEGFCDGWGGDIDGSNFEEYLDKHGVTDSVTVTAELRERCGSSNCCCEDGDSCNRIKPEFMKMLRDMNSSPISEKP